VKTKKNGAHGYLLLGVALEPPFVYGVILENSIRISFTIHDVYKVWGSVRPIRLPKKFNLRKRPLVSSLNGFLWPNLKLIDNITYLNSAKKYHNASIFVKLNQKVVNLSPKISKLFFSTYTLNKTSDYCVKTSEKMALPHSQTS
jgi:hypothetical protein